MQREDHAAGAEGQRANGEDEQRDVAEFHERAARFIGLPDLMWWKRFASCQFDARENQKDPNLSFRARCRLAPTRLFGNAAPGETRTPDPLLRRQANYFP